MHVLLIKLESVFVFHGEFDSYGQNILIKFCGFDRWTITFYNIFYFDFNTYYCGPDKVSQ